jgi:hypothetical protein
MRIRHTSGHVVFPGTMPTGNLVWVDAVNGNDSLATRGQLSVPFKTLTAAKNAASEGDTIMVLPGTYYDHDLAEDGINWHFFSGAKVIGDVSGTGTALFDVPEDAAMVVSGEGEFDTTYDSDYVLKIAASGAEIDFAARNIVGRVSAVQVTAESVVRVRADRISSSIGSCLDVRDGVVTIDAVEVSVATTGVIGLYFQGAGETHVRAQRISGGLYAAFCVGDVTVDIEAYEMQSPSSALVVGLLGDDDGVVTIRNTRLLSADSSDPTVWILDGFTATPPGLRLWNCFLKTASGESIKNDGTGAAYVGLYGKCTANDGFATNVSAVGDTLEVAALD